MARPRKPCSLAPTGSSRRPARWWTRRASRPSPRAGSQRSWGVSGPSLYNHFHTKDEIPGGGRRLLVSAQVDLSMFEDGRGVADSAARLGHRLLRAALRLITLTSSRSWPTAPAAAGRPCIFADAVYACESGRRRAGPRPRPRPSARDAVLHHGARRWVPSPAASWTTRRCLRPRRLPAPPAGPPPGRTAEKIDERAFGDRADGAAGRAGATVRAGGAGGLSTLRCPPNLRTASWDA